MSFLKAMIIRTQSVGPMQEHDVVRVTVGDAGQGAFGMSNNMIAR